MQRCLNPAHVSARQMKVMASSRGSRPAKRNEPSGISCHMHVRAGEEAEEQSLDRPALFGPCKGVSTYITAPPWMVNPWY